MADSALQQGQTQVILPAYEPEQTRTANAELGREQRFLNCWAETYKSGVTGEVTYAVNMRPGLNAGVNPSGGSGTIASQGTSSGMVCLANMVVTQLYDVYVAAFFNNATSRIFIIQYRPIANTTSLIGTIGNATTKDGGGTEATFNCSINDKVFITECTQGDSLLPAINISYQKADQSSGTGYHAISSAGVFPAGNLRVIDSTSFPSNLAGTPKIITGPFQFMNGTTFIMTLDGFIYNSSYTAAGNPDYTTWNTLSTVAASQYPDRGVGVYRYKHLLLAVGQDSIEFWSPDNNNPPASPLVHTDQAFIKFGAVAPKLCINVDDIFYWVAYGSGGTVGVWKLDGYTPTKISTSEVDQMISFTLNAGIYASGLIVSSFYSLETLTLLGKRHLILNGMDLGVGKSVAGFWTNNMNHRCFNITDGTWWEMGLPTKLTPSGTATVAAIMPAVAFPDTSHAGLYNQFCFRRGYDVSQTQDDMASTIAFVFNQGSVYTDTFVASGGSTANDQPVIMQWQSNYHWFGTANRKRVSKIRVLVDGVDGDALVSSIAGIFYSRHNNTANYIQRTDIMSSQDENGEGYLAYVNNCGMGKSWQIGVVAKATSGVGCRFTGVELFVGQTSR